MIKAIMVAKGNNNVIGRNNDLVWHMPADLKQFKDTTSGHYVIMGRKTFESMGKPLIRRLNIIVTRKEDFSVEGAVVKHSIEEALDFALDQRQKMVFILGGGQIYKQAMPLADKLYVTEIHAEFEGDTTFPAIDSADWEEKKRMDFTADAENPHDYSFVEYGRR
jgi:dihydrofolate reductase